MPNCARQLEKAGHANIHFRPTATDIRCRTSRIHSLRIAKPRSNGISKSFSARLLSISAQTAAGASDQPVPLRWRQGARRKPEGTQESRDLSDRARSFQEHVQIVTAPQKRRRKRMNEEVGSVGLRIERRRKDQSFKSFRNLNRERPF